MSLMRAFLDDILATKSRDVALIFADWLDDNGEPLRAAAIRAAVSHHTAVRRADYTSNPKAAFRAWQAYCWPAPLTVSHKMFGLVTGVVADGAGWLKYGPEVVTAHPIQHVWIRRAATFYEASGYHWLSEAGDSVIPPEIIRLMPTTGFTGLKAARRGLSAACIAWAREASC